VTFPEHPLDPTRDLEFVREVDVPPAVVWRAWTTPDLLRQWFTPRPYETTQCEIDLRPGGRFRFVMRSPEGEETATDACYLEIVPAERLVWTTALGPGYRPQPAEMPVTAALDLRPTASGGTRYRAVASHRNPQEAAEHGQGFAAGWGAALDQLVALMRTEPAR
jgi:uncharacterized protein YndB with AHSA1/START domain